MYLIVHELRRMCINSRVNSLHPDYSHIELITHEDKSSAGYGVLINKPLVAVGTPDTNAIARLQSGSHKTGSHVIALMEIMQHPHGKQRNKHYPKQDYLY